MQLLDGLLRRGVPSHAAEARGHILRSLLAPLGDLVGVHVELLGEFGQGLVTRRAAKSTLALNCGQSLRRDRLMVFSRRGSAKDTDAPITYRPVQKTKTGSPFRRLAGAIERHVEL